MKLLVSLALMLAALIFSSSCHNQDGCGDIELNTLQEMFAEAGIPPAEVTQIELLFEDGNSEFYMVSSLLHQEEEEAIYTVTSGDTISLLYPINYDDVIFCRVAINQPCLPVSSVSKAGIGKEGVTLVTLHP